MKEEAREYRHKKIKEIYLKPENERTETDIYIIHRWAEMYGVDL